MVTGVAFCPQAPALVPDIGRGLDAELGPLRAACRAALRVVLRDGARLEVVGHDVAEPVVDWLLDGLDASAAPTGIATGTATGTDTVPDTALLVLGDGSARRTEKAPGHLDDRAAPFDTRVGEALRSGEPARLAALDAGLGAELLAAGVPAWHDAAARLPGARFAADLLYDDAPFGVGYFVASWLRA